MDVCAHSYSLITATYVFICVLNFCGWSQPRNFLHSKIFPIYGSCFESCRAADGLVLAEMCPVTMCIEHLGLVLLRGYGQLIVHT